MGNIETTTKFSRLNSISSIEDNYSFTLVIYLFSNVTLQITKENIILYCEEKFFSAFSLQLQRKMFIEIRLCNLMIYVFKGRVKIVKIFMVVFHVSILNRLKIMFFFFCKYKVNT